MLETPLLPRKSRKTLSPSPPPEEKTDKEDESAVSATVQDEQSGLTSNHVVLGNGSPLSPHSKLINVYMEKKYQARKQDPNPHGQTEDESADCVQHSVAAIEVDVEINIIDDCVDDYETPSQPVKPTYRRKSTTPQRTKPCINSCVAKSQRSNSASPNTVHNRPALVNSPSEVSIISEAAVEELADLRNYYSNQLRRINYVSHEYLQQHQEPGVLACIREPLRCVRLPRGSTIAQTARNIWTRVSTRRKRVLRTS